MKLGSLFGELWRVPTGRVGIILLGILVAASLAVIVTYPADFGTARWANPSVWADNPKNVPPAWVNLFSRDTKPRHRIFGAGEPDSVEAGARAVESRYVFPFEDGADGAPGFLSLTISGITFAARSPIITVTLERPDGTEVLLTRHVTAGPRSGETGPYTRHDQEPLRLSLDGGDRTTGSLMDVFTETYGIEVSAGSIETAGTLALFGYPDDTGGFTRLPGAYRVVVSFIAEGKEDRIGSAALVVGGSVYGVMGTDALGRDLAVGLLFGLPVALLIGISTSLVSTLLGMTLGLVSGYAGGKTDIIIQRSADIVANVPVLPLLIFLVFIGGSKLWIILLVLVAFSWPGLTIMIRTMVLQLRNGQEVEAARALGASGARVVFRHIFPHTASYTLAQLVFFAPSAILSEAGLSFLGLGDPSIPTWGQILEYGFRTGAVFLGYWWWVIPPGLMIVLTAVTFMFLALGLEPIVDPRLKRRRSWHF